jgi:AcrR family transcriptional regulator
VLAANGRGQVAGPKCCTAMGRSSTAVRPRDPRRVPSQDRSRQTVDAILTAVEQIAEEVGLERLKVSTIAKRAGVTLGTFYQYFNGIDSVIAGWEERELERDTAALFARIADHAVKLPVYEVVIRDLVTYVFESFCRRARLFRTAGGRDFMSRRAARGRIAEQAVKSIALAIEQAPGAERIRGTNYVAMLRCVVKATTYIAFDLALSDLPEDEALAVREECIRMVTFYVLCDASL